MLSRRGFIGTLTSAAAVNALPNFSFAEDLFPRSQQASPARSSEILLNSNENAYGPSPRVVEAMRNSLAHANRYPDTHHSTFEEKLAETYRIKREEVVAGCGSTDLLRMAADAYTGPGKKLVMATPTFEAISVYAQRRGAEIVKVPLTGDFAHDLDAMLDATRRGSGLVYICNPNNPTGSLTPSRELAEFATQLPRGFVLLVDEAYHEYAVDAPEYGSMIPRQGGLEVTDALIVTRTFSKIHALAGLRLGFAISSAKLLKPMREHELPQGVNAVVAQCGTAALDDGAALGSARTRNTADRTRFVKEAAKRKLAVIPSHTNFVMLESGRPVRQVISHFRQSNIHVGRPFPPLETHVRVSLGLPQEMEKFWDVWDRMPATRAN